MRWLFLLLLLISVDRLFAQTPVTSSPHITGWEVSGIVSNNYKIHVFSQPAKNVFKINGSISPLETGIIYISYYNGEKAVTDSSKIINGEFEFSGIMDHSVIARLSLVPDSDVLLLFIDPTTMNVQLSNDPFTILKVEGSTTHQELSEWVALSNNARNQLTRISEAIEIEKDIDKLRLLKDSLVFYYGPQNLSTMKGSIRSTYL